MDKSDVLTFGKNQIPLGELVLTLQQLADAGKVWLDLRPVTWAWLECINFPQCDKFIMLMKLQNPQGSDNGTDVMQLVTLGGVKNAINDLKVTE